jgi:hypothetical protein
MVVQTHYVPQIDAQADTSSYSFVPRVLITAYETILSDYYRVVPSHQQVQTKVNSLKNTLTNINDWLSKENVLLVQGFQKLLFNFYQNLDQRLQPQQHRP